MDKTEAKQLQEDLGVSKEVVLKYPVRLGSGHLLEKLTLRRPKVGDIRAVSHLATDAEQELVIFSRLTGLVPEDLDMLDFADYKVLQNSFRLFQEE